MAVPASSAAIGEAVAASCIQNAVLKVIVNIMLTDVDTTSTSTNSARYWPFRTEMSTLTTGASTSDLYFKAYTDGQNTFKTDAAIAITIPTAAAMGVTGSSGSGANGYCLETATVAVFTLPAAGNAAKDTSVSVTGMMQYKIVAASWGGASSGCKASSPCASSN